MSRGDVPWSMLASSVQDVTRTHGGNQVEVTQDRPSFGSTSHTISKRPLKDIYVSIFVRSVAVEARPKAITLKVSL